MAVSWLPRRDAERLLWLQNFALKLNNYVGTAGILASDVTNMNTVRDQVQWILNRTDQIRTVSQDLTTLKKILFDGPNTTPTGAYPVAPTYPAPPAVGPTAGIFINITNFVERLKRTSGYTEVMGEDLGIIGPVTIESIVDPTFTALAQPNSEIRLNWVKGSSDGVIIESQRGAETVWTLLATDRFSPYLDARPPLVVGEPEVRRYRVRYLDGDAPVGNYSAIVSATTVP